MPIQKVLNQNCSTYSPVCSPIWYDLLHVILQLIFVKWSQNSNNVLKLWIIKEINSPFLREIFILRGPNQNLDCFLVHKLSNPLSIKVICEYFLQDIQKWVVLNTHLFKSLPVSCVVDQHEQDCFVALVEFRRKIPSANRSVSVLDDLVTEELPCFLSQKCPFPLKVPLLVNEFELFLEFPSE